MTFHKSIHKIYLGAFKCFQVVKVAMVTTTFLVSVQSK